jgi:SOS-response transcriptional repressor LexA
MNRRQEVGARIRQAREEMGLSQQDLGRRYGASGAQISQIERGVKELGIIRLEKLANILGKSVGWFYESDEPVSLTLPPLKRMIKDIEAAAERLSCLQVPVIGAIPAGTPFVEEEQVSDYLPVPRGMLSGAARDVYALRVSGNSLISDGIVSGDFAVIEPETDFLNGQIYAVRLENEVVLRRVYREADCWRLEASEGYQPIRRQDAEIMGRLVLCLRKYA